MPPTADASPSLFDHPAAGGVLLMLSAAAALIFANSPAASLYFDGLAFQAGPLTVTLWINDALMALFFLLVGLEIKREMLTGKLSTTADRVLPGVAALGGMIVPALMYLAFNTTTGGSPRGWAIPSATDIAFALGAMSLLGPRVPAPLKLFLTALAIIDDLGAVLIIAAFYTDHIDLAALAGAAAVVGLLIALNRRHVTRLWPYLILGAVLWSLFMRAGVHATLAGVVLALTIPVEAGDRSPLVRLEHALQPWVSFLIVPVFGFANAGVSFQGVTQDSLQHPVVLGIALGLFVGKQIGVFGFAWVAIRLGWAALPTGTTLRQLHAVAVLCGIGFTMSLFIGLLAFPTQPVLQDLVRIGVLLGSVASAVIGAFMLRTWTRTQTQTQTP